MGGAAGEEVNGEAQGASREQGGGIRISDEGYNLNGDTSAPCGICIWCEQEKDGTTATGGQLLAAGWRFTTRATASGTHD